MAIFAYIDAGSGSMIVQVLIAGALAIPFFFRRAIGDAVRRIRGSEQEAADSRTVSERTER
jgi:hypothetical protein